MKFTNSIASNCEDRQKVKQLQIKLCLKLHALTQTRRKASILHLKKNSKIKKCFEWQGNGDKYVCAALLSSTATCVFLCYNKSI